MSSALLQLKAETYRLAIEKMTGVSPDIAYRTDNSAVIYWSPQKAQLLRAWVDSQLSRKPSKPSDIDVQIMPAIQPLIAKKIIPYVVTLVGVGLIGGLLAGKYL